VFYTCVLYHYLAKFTSCPLPSTWATALLSCIQNLIGNHPDTPVCQSGILGLHHAVSSRAPPGYSSASPAATGTSRARIWRLISNKFYRLCSSSTVHSSSFALYKHTQTHPHCSQTDASKLHTNIYTHTHACKQSCSE
jgi:hypothetical protein